MKSNFYSNIFLFRVPKLKVTHDEQTNEVSVDVSDDPFQYDILDVSNLPVLITVGQVKSRLVLKFKRKEKNELFGLVRMTTMTVSYRSVSRVRVTRMFD